MNQTNEYQIAWNLLVELRKEITETQKIRAQVIGFKITFVTTVIGYILSNLNSTPAFTLLVPAFAAIFFDFLITSYSFSIKRTGAYIRNYLEEIIRTKSVWSDKYPLWEEYMNRKENRQSLAMWGNYGITIIAFVLGIVGLFSSSESNIQLTNLELGIATSFLAIFMIIDTVSSFKPRVFLKKEIKEEK